MSTEVVKSLREAEKVGMKQYLKVVDDVFINCNKSIMDVLHDNKVLTFSSKTKKGMSRAKVEKALLKHNNNLFAQLLMSNNALDEEDKEEFFSHENDEEPPSIVFGGKIRSGKKVDILACITNESSIAVSMPENVTYECLDSVVIEHHIKGK